MAAVAWGIWRLAGIRSPWLTLGWGCPPPVASGWGGHGGLVQGGQPLAAELGSPGSSRGMGVGHPGPSSGAGGGGQGASCRQSPLSRRVVSPAPQLQYPKCPPALLQRSALAPRDALLGSLMTAQSLISLGTSWSRSYLKKLTFLGAESPRWTSGPFRPAPMPAVQPLLHGLRRQPASPPRPDGPRLQPVVDQVRQDTCPRAASRI